MLILTRKTGESIMIGDEVKITILSVNMGQVKIGFEAPRNISIHREEIYEQIKSGDKSNIWEAMLAF